MILMLIRAAFSMSAAATRCAGFAAISLCRQTFRLFDYASFLPDDARFDATSSPYFDAAYAISRFQFELFFFSPFRPACRFAEDISVAAADVFC